MIRLDKAPDHGRSERKKFAGRMVIQCEYLRVLYFPTSVRGACNGGCERRSAGVTFAAAVGSQRGPGASE